MLHAVLRDGGHSAEYFTGKCGDEVICGRECGPNEAPVGAIEAAVTALEVNATLHPSALSLSRQDGRATVVVRVRNPTGRSVFVPGRLFATTLCAVGYQIAGVTDPARYDMNCDLFRYHADGRIYWGPGETRRIVLESDLRVSAFANPLGIVAISVTAILADNLRKTTHATIRP